MAENLEVGDATTVTLRLVADRGRGWWPVGVVMWMVCGPVRAAPQGIQVVWSLARISSPCAAGKTLEACGGCSVGPVAPSRSAFTAAMAVRRLTDS